MASTLRYKLQTNVQTYEIRPRIPSEPIPGFTQKMIDGLHKAASHATVALMERLWAEDKTVEFEKWWIEDESGNVVHESDVLTVLVPAAN
jgi:hypothetical protein